MQHMSRTYQPPGDKRFMVHLLHVMTVLLERLTILRECTADLQRLHYFQCPDFH